MKQNNSNYIDKLLTSLMGGDERLTDTTGSGNKEKQFDAEDGYRRFCERTGQPVLSQQRTTVMRQWARWAAVVAMVVLVALLARQEGQYSMSSQFGDIVVETPLGATTQITLPDGTQVWLNAGSQLTYSQGFGVEQRNVSLQGEGYFEVAHDAEHPFAINNKNLKVRVLGTKFNFSNYDDDNWASVSLLEGSVALESSIGNKTNSIKLKPNQRCMLDKQTGRLTVEDQDDCTSAKLWTEGLLFFDEEPLEEIAHALQHSYNVKVHFESEDIRQIKFYGQFARREQNIGEVLEILSATGIVKYRIEEQDIYLSRRK